MGDDPTYVYSPLDANVDSIRLVVLEPCKDPTRKIRCHIRHMPFREKPKYEALSYTWGDHPASEKILIGGAQFLVGPNLLQALHHLKYGQKARVLWIDAICINQADIHEKNKQISFMPYIYTRAQCVLVWLGVPTSAAMSDILYDRKVVVANPMVLKPNLWQSLFSAGSIIDSGGIELLETMCNELYWTRLWIIQESKRSIVSFSLVNQGSSKHPI
jgi:Heterokaryon incompatibility protein (HET)